MNNRLLHASLVLAFAFALPSCDEESSSEPASDVIYEGGATDEALDALLAKTAQDIPAEGAVITWPVDGDILPKGEPLSFWFEVPGEEARREAEPSDARLGAVEPRGFDPAHPFQLGELPPILLSPLWSIPQTAKAHGTPISGRAFLLVLSTKDDPNLLRVFTTLNQYEPDEAALAIMHGVTGKITAQVTNALFEDNRVIEDGGPFEGTPIAIEFVD